MVVEESDEAGCCNCDRTTWERDSHVEAVKIAEGVSREEMVLDVPQSAVKPCRRMIPTH